MKSRNLEARMNPPSLKRCMVLLAPLYATACAYGEPMRDSEEEDSTGGSSGGAEDNGETGPVEADAIQAMLTTRQVPARATCRYSAERAQQPKKSQKPSPMSSPRSLSASTASPRASSTVSSAPSDHEVTLLNASVAPSAR